ncbi:MAG: protein kinase [Planctomycetes bacterium]|nr:protein kinase [Planctomycetota bacterium]
MTAPQSSQLRRVGDFLVLEEVGRGGMGVVYRAEQASLGRIVALKVLPSLVGLDASSVARFRREAETAGRISHPGIVPVYGVGEENGVHWFAMEFVEGPPLDRLLAVVQSRPPERLLGTLFEESGLDQSFPAMVTADRRNSGPGSRWARSCARLAADVASALAAAHREGVIHRDIKPSNILIRSSGQPVVVDFGLARDERTLGLTRTGDAIGTPNYMAPEQACGQSRVDGRVDVWGLGALLYELLTLRPPFVGGNAAEIMRRIVEEEPPPIRTLNARVPEDLVRIVETCLRKDPDARYAAIEAVELDLRNFLEGRPIVARRVGRVRRSVQFLTRHRVSVGVGAAVLALASISFGLMGVVSEREAEESGRVALEEARVAIEERLQVQLAQRAYGRAEALLGKDAVIAARRAHLAQAFESLYVQQLFGELAAYLDDWPESARDDDWRAMRERVEGRGRLVVDGLPEGTRVRLRPADDPAAEFREWRSSQALPLGPWLVELDAPGNARVVQRAVIGRDLDTRVVPMLVPQSRLDPAFDAVVVPEGKPGHAVLVARTELANGRLAELLADARHQRVTDEIRPEGWAGASAPEAALLPVRGVSWRMARAIAILADAHVVSAEEYLAAATAGQPRRARPFGAAMDWSRVAASPSGGLAAPLPVDSLSAGASVHGILHLVGNVRELLAPNTTGPVLAIGGDYSSDDPEELRVDGPLATLALAPDAVDPRVGLRLARFLPLQQSATERERAAQGIAAARAGAASVWSWSIERSGEVMLRLELRGNHAEVREQLDLSVVTPGFAIEGRPIARDGFGQELAVEVRERRLDASVLRVRLREPGRAGQAYQLEVGSRLTPLDGLFAQAAELRLAIPLKLGGGTRSGYSLRLPEGVRVDRVEPAPDWRLVEDGRETLWWGDAENGESPAMVGCAQLRCRVDGALSADWPSYRVGEEAMRTLCDALGASGTAARPLAALLDDDFVLRPHGHTKARLLATVDVPRDRFTLQRVVDVTAVGSIVAVTARVRWTAAPPAWRAPSAGAALETVIDDWPVVAFFRRHERGLLALTLGPEPQVDAGEYSEGRYRYEPLGVQFDVPPGIDLVRDRGQPAEMQILLRPRGSGMGAVHVLVLGYRAEAGEGAGDAVHRLTLGEAFAADARQLPAPPRASESAIVSEWLFGAQTAQVRRERWERRDVGRWKFLLRYVAAGDSEAAARGRFEAVEVQGFFQRVRELVGIGRP